MGRGTLNPSPSFNATADCEVLYNAMKGIGTNDLAVIEVIGARTSAEMKQVALQYKTMYGKDIVKDLCGEWKISGHFMEIVEYRFLTLGEFDAFCVRKAVEGLGTDEHALCEIFATRNNTQIKSLVQFYRSMYNRDIEQDVMGDTSGHFRRILVSLLQANRDESSMLDPAKAVTDAQFLYNNGEGRWGTNDTAFNEVLATRSFGQLSLIFDEYKKISSHDLEKAIEKEFSGHLKECLVALIKCSRNRANYFAEKLYHAMKGLSTDDRTLSRIIVSRCEIDLENIKQSYFTMYNKTLAHSIEHETSHDYKKILMRIVGNN